LRGREAPALLEEAVTNKESVKGAIGTRRRFGIPSGRNEHAFDYGPFVADLPIPELVENRQRSIAMLPTGAPALNRDEALEVLRQLADALREIRDLRRRVG
jgi:hypothetical protein